MYIDGSEIGETPTEVVFVWAHEVAAGAYGPAVATASAVNMVAPSKDLACAHEQSSFSNWHGPKFLSYLVG